MNLPVPLAVLLRNPKTGAHRDITRDLRDLRYRSAIPGGFASATLSLHRPLNIQPSEIDYYVDVTAYDRLTGEIAWDGWLEDPSRSASSDGQVWSLTAIGSAGHARERVERRVWVDRDMGAWRRVDNTTPGAQAQITDNPGTGVGVDALLLQLPNGLPIVTDSSVTMYYDRILGQSLGLYDYQWDAGIGHANLLVEGLASTDGVIDTLARSEAASTAGAGSSPRVIGTDFTSPRNAVKLRLRWTGGAAVIPNDAYWAALSGIVVVARRRDRNGNSITTGASYGTTVLASEVVEDLLGSLLTRYDGATAVITPTAYPIEQLAYPDGVMPAKVFDDLIGFESDMYWAAWERLTSGKYRFEFVPWQTGIRYEASIVGGFEAPASAAGLYNRVTVRYRDSSGAIRDRSAQATVPALDNAGVIRQKLIDLGDEVGTVAAADRAADQFLLQHSTPPNAGRITIDRPIYDAVRGRMVPPWMIRPGGLLRARGVEPRRDALNPAGRDGATVFRLVGTEFSAADAATVCELDSTPLSVAASLAELRTTAGRRRR